MNIHKLIAALIVIATIAACGGGGGGSPAVDNTSKTTITGIATKGPFVFGSTVSVYAITNNLKGARIKQTATTDNNGSYSADLGSYTGPVIIEVSGSYLDEATGTTVTILPTAPLRAALPDARGYVSLAVTPLTELAVLKTGGNFSSTSITDANTLVSSLFKVDIIATLPVVPTSAGLAGATQAQKDYTLVLAAISQMASTSTGSTTTDKLNSALSTLNLGISSSGMTPNTIIMFQTALSDFVKPTNANNKTGINDTSSTSVVNVGTLSNSYTLSLQGNGAGSVMGVTFDLALPSGVTVNVNSSDSSVLSSSLSLSSAITKTMLTAKYANNSATIGLSTTQGLSAGVIATLICNIPSGATVPPGSAFNVTNLSVVGLHGVPISGVTVAIQ